MAAVTGIRSNAGSTRTGSFTRNRIAQPAINSEAASAATRFANLSGTEKTTDDPPETVSAAIQGRVDSLLYDPKAELFGECDFVASTINITGNADDDDLVDTAAVETLRHGGMIHAMTGQDIPTNGPLAAILRY